MVESRPAVILASASRTRRDLLAAAGVALVVVPAGLDEAGLQSALAQKNPTVDPASVAEALARAKAEAVSRMHPEALVIGSDQVLAIDGELLGKPSHIGEAREMLSRLAGRTHSLHTAAAIALGGSVDWVCAEEARLTMRRFSAAALESCLAAEGDGVCASAGAYRIEGRAIQLFERIEGDYFTVLGLPLLAVVNQLVARGALER